MVSNRITVKIFDLEIPDSGHWLIAPPGRQTADLEIPDRGHTVFYVNLWKRWNGQDRGLSYVNKYFQKKILELGKNVIFD